jgi:MFS family permease
MVLSSAAPVRRLWLAVLAGYLALGATLQTLPGFVVQRFQGGPVDAGLAVGIAFAATACARPFAGRAADAGHARPVVLLGGLLTAVGAAGHLLAPNLAVLLVARLVMGAGEAALFSAALPWVLTGTPAHHRGRTAGWFGLSMWGGLATGPLAAALLEHAASAVAVWWCVLALGIASAVLVSTTPPPEIPVDRPTALPSRWRDIVPRGASLPGLGFGLSSYGYGAINGLLLLYLRQQHLGGDTLALAVFGVAFLAVRALGSPQVDRYGGATVAIAVLLVEALGLGLIAGPPLLPTVLLGAALCGSGVSLMYPATVSMTLQRTGPLTPGTSVGVMTSFWDLGIMIAGPVSGVVADHAGYHGAFAVAAALAVIAVAVPTALRRTTGPSRAQTTSNPQHEPAR